MRAKIVAAVLNLGLNYLRKHPEILDKVATLIPGKLDDVVIAALKKLI